MESGPETTYTPHTEHDISQFEAYLYEDAVVVVIYNAELKCSLDVELTPFEARQLAGLLTREYTEEIK